MIFDYCGLFGFDISTYQDTPLVIGHIDFVKMRDYGASFVIIKAGQGDWSDPDWQTNWIGARDILPRSSYWYYDNHYEPKAQARKYWSIIMADPEGICWIDLEDQRPGFVGWHNWYDFIEEFKRVSGLPYERIGIYTSYYFWRDNTDAATTAQMSYFAKFPLWLAAYGMEGSDPLHPNYGLLVCPAPWLTPLILQTGTPAIGEAAGVESKEIDYDQFNGDCYEFVRYFRVIEPTEPPTEPEPETGDTTVATYAGKAGVNGAKVWSVCSGTTLSNQVDTIKPYAPVTGYAPVDGIVKLISPYTGYFTKYAMLLDYKIVTVVPPPVIDPPPVPPPAVDTVTVDIDVTATINGKAYSGTMQGLELVAE